MNASWIRFLASRYLTMASAVSSEDGRNLEVDLDRVGLGGCVGLAGDGEALDVLAPAPSQLVWPKELGRRMGELRRV